MINLISCKVRKPLVIAATKCDEANEVLVRELERLVNKKEFKSFTIPVVETSAHENINVDQAFFVLAQLIDKSRGRSRIVSYMESAAVRQELLDLATEGYARLLRQRILEDLFHGPEKCHGKTICNCDLHAAKKPHLGGAERRFFERRISLEEGGRGNARRVCVRKKEELNDEQKRRRRKGYSLSRRRAFGRALFPSKGQKGIFLVRIHNWFCFLLD